MMEQSQSPCPWCGNLHPGKCVLIREITYYRDGKTIKSVKFWSPEVFQSFAVGKPWFPKLAWPPPEEVQ